MLPILALLAAAPQAECYAFVAGGATGQARLAEVAVPRASLTLDPVPARPGAKPYLVRGDKILIGTPVGGYVPAFYPGERPAFGCLPAAAVHALPAPPPSRPADWFGSWIGHTLRCCSASFDIVRKGAGIHIQGFATWTPEGLPMGTQDDEIDEDGTTRGDTMAIARDEPGCGYDFQMLGRYLIVTQYSSDRCVGTHADFSGVYTRG